jgi:hypothetical protein
MESAFREANEFYEQRNALEESRLQRMRPDLKRFETGGEAVPIKKDPI